MTGIFGIAQSGSLDGPFFYVGTFVRTAEIEYGGEAK